VLNRNTRNKKFLKSYKKNTFESHSSTLEQVEERILGLKDKIDIKEKTEAFLERRRSKMATKA
jgi:hypothetical protein